MATRVGFIGLGLMGRPMARRLIGAGFEVHVFNRSRAAVDALAAEGATAADSIADAAREAEVVVTMLPDTPDVELVLAGPGGVFAAAQRETLVVDMSTIAPAAARALDTQARDRGLRFLDAPVSGGDVGAQSGTLSIMAGGEPADFEAARPLFEAMGRTIIHCGPAGSGQLVKACNQVVVGIVFEAVSEAIVLAERTGLDPSVMMQVLQGGLAHTRIMELRGARMVARDFKPGFRARLHLKDLRIVSEEAASRELQLPFASQVREMLASLVERGEGQLDHSALLTVVQRMAAS